MWPRTGACSARWPGSSTRRPDRLPCDASLAACGPATAGPAQNLKGTVPFRFAGGCRSGSTSAAERRGRRGCGGCRRRCAGARARPAARPRRSACGSLSCSSVVSLCSWCRQGGRAQRCGYSPCGWGAGSDGVKGDARTGPGLGDRRPAGAGGRAGDPVRVRPGLAGPVRPRGRPHPGRTGRARAGARARRLDVGAGPDRQADRRRPARRRRPRGRAGLRPRARGGGLCAADPRARLARAPDAQAPGREPPRVRADVAGDRADAGVPRPPARGRRGARALRRGQAHAGRPLVAVRAGLRRREERRRRGDPVRALTESATKTVGRYAMYREIGRGGMATVHLARQTDLDRLVALKELAAFHASDPTWAKRFLRESRVAGSLSHPNIVTVYDYFEHDGTPYIAMEHVERGSLRAYVSRMTPAQIGGVMEGLLAGLAHAEASGIVHRDLKPENLMVTADGRVKIADFGIAKATTKMQTGAFLTATGTTVGTPTYMAPEQAMAQDIGPWTDLYSVGCMAFELFTGNVPFHDSDAPMAILLRHVNEPIARVDAVDPSVDHRIADWIERLLVKDPAQRTRSAAAAWDDFEEILLSLLGPRWRREAA